jgi:catechol 2,3-dioxygenase-like lactoylglutathione lyase family enzyme
MRDKIDKLILAYDEKRISRRQLIGALLMASATSPLAASAGQQKPAVNLTGTPPPNNALFRGRIVNHVTLRVKDVDASRHFYQELLGASVLLDGRTSEQTGAVDLLLGDSFVTVSGGRGAPAIDHFAIGLDPWPGADRALDMVEQRFPHSEARANQNQFSKAAEVRSVMLKDPDGINVQLGSVKYQL